MSFTTIVVIVPTTSGGVKSRHLSDLELRPLVSVESPAEFLLLAPLHQDDADANPLQHRLPEPTYFLSPPPTQVWMQFTYSLMGRSTMIPFLSRERERPNALVFIHYEYFRFKTAPPASVERWATAVRGVDSAPLRGFPIAGFNDVEHLYHEVSPHRHTQAFAPGRSSDWPGL